MSPATNPLIVRVTLEVLKPVTGCAYTLQQGKDGLGAIQIAADADLVFTAELVVRPDREGRADLAGPWVHGPRGGRFLYLNSGTLAGQPDSAWTRRAKILLGDLIDALANGTLVAPVSLHGRLPGRARDGGPVCASTALEAPGWKVGDRT